MCETSTVSQKSQICACKGTKFLGKYNICMDNIHENALISEFFFTQIDMINFNSVNTVMLNG